MYSCTWCFLLCTNYTKNFCFTNFYIRTTQQYTFNIVCCFFRPPNMASAQVIIIIIIIIILSRHQHGYPWPDLITPPYRSSLPVGPLGYTRILTELLYEGSSCPPCFCSAMWRSTSLMSSSLLLQQCPACLVSLTWIFFVIGCRWLYSSCFVGCCL